MNFAAYVDIRANNPTAFVNKIGLWKFIFQQDNDDKHTSKLSKVNFRKERHRIVAIASTITRFKSYRDSMGPN